MKTKTQSSKTSGSSKSSTRSAKNSKETLEDIFEETLKDIYWAEKHLTKALTKMSKAAYNEELRDAFDTHLEETEMQIGKLEKCFELLGKKPVAKKCEAMEGLIKEGEEQIEEHEEGHARDAALIGAAQKVEHYEISAYGTLRTMANVLGMTQCAELLEEIKDEEAETDVKLTELAEKINLLACEVDEEEV
ncbi:ferritin-like domain-containing protein [Chryseolinea sp. H1M3-3]|uniref:YciE/YciF ferroxidase family protein n=1 Tax=Chryseolinea sp. H1M3-3 TaxID=3034144 RepID=UPI0023EAF5A6|nr:ferritin-like domain-containing protein [Chryseolinea sp. H1M3-3]